MINTRQQNDSSIVNERVKTDDSFAGRRKQTESQTDKKVRSARQGADDIRDLSRKNIDDNINLARSGRSKSLKNRTFDEMTADNTLSAQRATDDAAVTSERQMMDSVLMQERLQSGVSSSRYIDQERQYSDQNTLRERQSSDLEALTSSNLLSVEISSHQLTRAALTSRDELLAIVSHDLRNPIGAILSFSELLLEDEKRNDPETVSWVKVIQRNAENSLRLINDILDIERYAEGKLHMKFAATDLQSLITETVENFQNSAEERKIFLTVTPLPELPAIKCDSGRIIQVLTNLIGNALKFTPRAGQITVWAQLNEEHLIISVRDTGPGIAEEQKKRIFDRYTQISNKDRQGLGLGLYISTLIAEAHRGQITVESTIGLGSQFNLSLPLNS